LSLVHAYIKQQADQTIKIFYYNICQPDKQLIIEEFQKPSESLLIHVVFTTEAIEISINLLDIRQYVLYEILREDKHPAIL
jgi:hypothetical protein